MVSGPFGQYRKYQDKRSPNSTTTTTTGTSSTSARTNNHTTTFIFRTRHSSKCSNLSILVHHTLLRVTSCVSFETKPALISALSTKHAHCLRNTFVLHQVCSRSIKIVAFKFSNPNNLSLSGRLLTHTRKQRICSAATRPC